MSAPAAEDATAPAAVPVAVANAENDQQQQQPAAAAVPPAPDASPNGSIVPVLACVLHQLCLRNDTLPLNRKQVSKFHSLRPPGIAIPTYLQRIEKYAACSGECFVLALVYIDRIIQCNPSFVVNSLNIHRLLITSVMLAAKFFDDQYFNNSYYAKVGGVPCSEINSLEVEFLFMTNFTLFVSADTYRQYYMELCNHAMNSNCNCAQQTVPPLLLFNEEEVEEDTDMEEHPVSQHWLQLQQQQQQQQHFVQQHPSVGAGAAESTGLPASNQSPRWRRRRVPTEGGMGEEDFDDDDDNLNDSEDSEDEDGSASGSTSTSSRPSTRLPQRVGSAGSSDLPAQQHQPQPPHPQVSEFVAPPWPHDDTLPFQPQPPQHHRHQSHHYHPQPQAHPDAAAVPAHHHSSLHYHLQQHQQHQQHQAAAAAAQQQYFGTAAAVSAGAPRAHHHYARSTGDM